MLTNNQLTGEKMLQAKNKYRTIIGAEVHVELNTESKMFCSCKNDPFGADKPNIYTCPVCLGLPGALPVPNDKALDYTIMIGKALGCEIAKESVFDRKHYFYPDLPKGYQISQLSKPLCFDGKIETELGTVRINRVHLEEDTAKLIHDTVGEDRVSLIDFNRSGVPLVEIVTEPDIKSPEHAVLVLKKLRQIVRYLGVSGADMEKGSMRLEANISLSDNDSLPDYKVEVKNINSFKFYKLATEYEIRRHSEILDSGKVPAQETRGWDEDSGKTVSQRSKESEQDYGYFPEPDIPPIDIKESRLKQIMENMPLLPSDYIKSLIEIGISKAQVEILSSSKDSASFVLEAVKLSGPDQAQDIANRVINKKLDITSVSPKQAVKLLQKESEDKISGSALEKIVKQAVSEMPDVANDYKKGKREALGPMIGKVVQISEGKADAREASEILRKMLG